MNRCSSISDIGKNFNDYQLNLSDYLAVEDNYVSTVMHFLEESGLSSLYLVDLGTEVEVPQMVQEIGLDKLLDDGLEIYEKQEVSGKDIERICRLNLRELIWCKLEEENFFIHFGYDYYMYLGSLVYCNNSIIYAQKVGLFVEEMPSPYF